MASLDRQTDTVLIYVPAGCTTEEGSMRFEQMQTHLSKKSHSRFIGSTFSLQLG